MSLKYYNSEDIENYNTKLDELKNEAKVYSNIRFNTLVKLNKTMKLSEIDNKAAAMKKSTNYVVTTLKALSIVVIKGKRKG